MKTEEIAYDVGGKRYLGYLAVDETQSGKRPGVLLGPEGPGRGPLVMSFARKLAERALIAKIGAGCADRNLPSGRAAPHHHAGAINIAIGHFVG